MINPHSTSNGLANRPALRVRRVGDDLASSVYLCTKRKTRHPVGFQSFDYDPPPATTRAQLTALITGLNGDLAEHGILLRSSLLAHINEDAWVDSLDPYKARDSFRGSNMGRLAQRGYGVRSRTPNGVMTLRGHTDRPARGEHAVVAGVSSHVSRPLVPKRLSVDGTTTCWHTFTGNRDAHVRPAEIFIVVVSTAGLVKGEWIKPGAVMIDVAISRLDDGVQRDRNYAGNGRSADPLSVRRRREEEDGRCVENERPEC